MREMVIDGTRHHDLATRAVAWTAGILLAVGVVLASIAYWRPWDTGRTESRLTVAHTSSQTGTPHWILPDATYGEVNGPISGPNSSAAFAPGNSRPLRPNGAMSTSLLHRIGSAGLRLGTPVAINDQGDGASTIGIVRYSAEQGRTVVVSTQRLLSPIPISVITGTPDSSPVILSDGTEIVTRTVPGVLNQVVAVRGDGVLFQVTSYGDKVHSIDPLFTMPQLEAMVRQLARSA